MVLPAGLPAGEAVAMSSPSARGLNFDRPGPGTPLLPTPLSVPHHRRAVRVLDFEPVLCGLGGGWARPRRRAQRRMALAKCGALALNTRGKEGN
jgi:hypothetical protein